MTPVVYTELSVPSALPAVPVTLADLRALVLAHVGLAPRRQRDLLSALLAVSKALGQPLGAILCQPALLQARLGKLTARQAGLSLGRWRNTRSLLAGALTLAGLVRLPGRLDTSPSEAWTALLAPSLSLDVRFRLSRFGRWCTEQAIEPLAVSDAVLQRFQQVLEEASLDADPKRRARDIAVMWNKASDTQPGWPAQRLTVADHRCYYTPGWSIYPATLLADFEALLAYLGRAGGTDLLDEAAPARALRPATLHSRRDVLRLYLGALVLSGEDAATLFDLRSVVTPARVRIVLNFFLKRSDNKPTLHTTALGRLALGIARHWVKVLS